MEFSKEAVTTSCMWLMRNCSRENADALPSLMDRRDGLVRERFVEMSNFRKFFASKPHVTERMHRNYFRKNAMIGLQDAILSVS